MSKQPFEILSYGPIKLTIDYGTFANWQIYSVPPKVENANYWVWDGETVRMSKFMKYNSEKPGFFAEDESGAYKHVNKVKYWAEVILPDRPLINTYSVEFEN